MIGAVSFLSACGSDEDAAIQTVTPVEVQTALARIEKQQETVSASGRIEAANSANISTRMMGNVTNLKVKVGEKVSKGQLLLTISNADLIAKMAQVEASISQASSAFDNASKDLERFQSLYEKGSATAKELENMTTRYEMSKAGLEAANQMKNEVSAQFAFTNIRAPFDGMVSNTFVKEGDIASPGRPLLTVEGSKEFHATVMVPESSISQIELGAAVKVLIKSEDRLIEGKVREVSPSAKNTGGQFIVKIDLPQKERLLPGQFVRVEINSSRSNERLTSPLVQSNALIRNGQMIGLYTIGSNNTAIMRWIRIGEQRGDGVEVLSGISDGEQYILNAKGKLFNGASVVVK